tara:strand:+ start:3712 stop:6282 length:2571 start_codon:yes stop_codon:yes gene_type:complete
MADKHLVMTFGRFNPPHVGHLKLANAVKDHAKKIDADHAVYLSQSHDKKKNPLPPDVKHGIAKKVLRGHNVVSHPKVRNMFHAAEHAAKNGYSHATLVVGSDRHEEMSKKSDALAKHSGLKSVNVVSAGHRDPDSHDRVERASGTEARKRAKSGVTSFKSIMPKHLSDREVRNIHSTLSTHLEHLDWFDQQEFDEFMEKPELLNEVAKYLPPDLYLVQKRKSGNVEVVVRPDPVDDSVLKGGPDKPKPTMTDIQGAINQKKFKQTPTSIEIFGDVSDMMKDVKDQKQTEKEAEAKKKEAEQGSPEDPGSEEDIAAAAEQQAQAEYDALDPFMPTQPPMSPDNVEYPGPAKNITQGRGVQFEWAIAYIAAKSAGVSDEALAKRDELAGNNLKAFGKDVFGMAKKTVQNIPEECRGSLKHSDEVGIFGRPEPKTDLICGDNRISVKMEGDIQLSSESAQTTARTLENLASAIGTQDNELMQSAAKKVSKSLKSLPNKMIDPKNLEEAMDRHGDKPWFQEMFKNGKLQDKYNWEKYKGSLTRDLQQDFTTFLSDNEDFKRHLVHEALTGSRAFADNPDAAATHLLSPAGFEEIGDVDGNYVSSLMPKTYVGIRAKSRGRITQPTFRFELKGKKLEIVEQNKPNIKPDGDMAFIMTPEMLSDFYTKNPQEILRELSSSLDISVSGDANNKMQEDEVFNVITVDGKTTKIPVLPEKPDFDTVEDREDDEMNESFSALFEQDDPSKRDYKHEYRTFHGKAKQRKKRSNRVLARRKMIKKGKARKGDGKDIDHKDGNALNNGDSNLRVRSVRSNRADNKHRLGEEHGAGDEGTDKLLKNYIEGTPGAKTPYLVSRKKGKLKND